LYNNPLYDSTAINAIHQDELDFSVNGTIYEVWMPAGFIIESNSMSEDELDNSSINLEIYPTNFTDNTLDPTNFMLANAPSGLYIESVEYIDNQHCKVDLAYDGRDFDSDITNLELIVKTHELADDSYGDLTFSDDMPDITANNDDESISIADDGEIREGAEDGEEITVTISNGEFADSITPANWTVTNLPSGVSKGSVSRVDDTTVKITLSGNSYIDFDIDITDVTVSCTKDEYLDSTGDSSLTANTGVTISDPPELSSLSPATGTGDQGLDDNLVITFDEIVNKNTGYIRIYKVADDSLVESINVTETQVTGSGTDTITIALGAAPMC